MANSRIHIASASWNTEVRKALSPPAGGAARLVGWAAAGAVGRRPTSAPEMLDGGLLVVAVAVAAVLAPADVLDVAPPEDPQPAAANAMPAITMTATERAGSVIPRSRTR